MRDFRTTAGDGPILVDVLPPEQLDYMFAELGWRRVRESVGVGAIRADVRGALAAAQQGSPHRQVPLQI